VPAVRRHHDRVAFVSPSRREDRIPRRRGNHVRGTELDSCPPQTGPIVTPSSGGRRVYLSVTERRPLAGQTTCAAHAGAFAEPF
jgi:hypothetical protein